MRVAKSRGSVSVDVMAVARHMASSGDGRLPPIVRRCRTTFWLAFRAVTGRSPTQHMVAMRVARACELLRASPDLRVADVAHQLGFSDEAHMCRRVMLWTGLRPSEIRRTARTTTDRTSRPESP